MSDEYDPYAVGDNCGGPITRKELNDLSVRIKRIEYALSQASGSHFRSPITEAIQDQIITSGVFVMGQQKNMHRRWRYVGLTLLTIIAAIWTNMLTQLADKMSEWFERIFHQ